MNELSIVYWHGDYVFGTRANPEDIDDAFGLRETLGNDEAWEGLIKILKTNLFTSINFGGEDLGWSISKEE